jgi:hypothetical protein
MVNVVLKFVLNTNNPVDKKKIICFLILKKTNKLKNLIKN